MCTYKGPISPHTCTPPDIYGTHKGYSYITPSRSPSICNSKAKDLCKLAIKSLQTVTSNLSHHTLLHSHLSDVLESVDTSLRQPEGTNPSSWPLLACFTTQNQSLSSWFHTDTCSPLRTDISFSSNGSKSCVTTNTPQTVLRNLVIFVSLLFQLCWRCARPSGWFPEDTLRGGGGTTAPCRGLVPLAL